MEKENKIEELRKKAANARWKLENAEEELRNKKLRPQMRKLVGKCFKYTNSYGSSYPTWPLYLKVLSIDEKDLSVNCVAFQRTSLERVEIELERKITYRGENQLLKWDGYNPIPVSEYNRAKKSLLKFMQDKLSL